LTQEAESLATVILTDWQPEAIAIALWIEVAYLLLVGPVRKRFRLGAPASAREVLWFSLAMVALILAEGSPIHVISERYLFGVHMLQHVLLTYVMPPLMILGLPRWVYRPLLGRFLPVAKFLTHPLVAIVAFNASYTLWHLPELYEAALYNHNVHLLEHFVMVSTAFLMWWPLMSKVPELPRLHDAAQLLYVFFMSVAQIGVFGVVTFSSDVFYKFYAEAPRVWDISPMVDQQLAGIVMKLGGMFIFVYLLARAFFRWAASEEAAGNAAARRPADGEKQGA